MKLSGATERGKGETPKSVALSFRYARYGILPPIHLSDRRARTLGALVRDPEGGFETQALLLCTDLSADLWEILRRFVMRWQLEVTFQEVCRHLGFDLVRRRPNRRPGTSPSGGPQSIATSESWACRRSSGCRKDRPHPPPPPGARSGATAPARSTRSIPDRRRTRGGSLPAWRLRARGR